MPEARPSPDLSCLFAPRAVAVIGASNRAGSVGRAVFGNMLHYGYAGVVYPVNPKSGSIMSVKAYPSVLDIPDAVDLAVVIVPRDLVPQVLAECGGKGINGAIVITAGFKELGGEGAEKEQEVLATAQKHGIRLLGPNCLGIITTDEKVLLNASFARQMPLPGAIALISQSGAVGVAALEYAQGEKIGISKFVSVGNKADLNENDFLAYLRDDPLTEVISLYLEDLADPQEFFRLAHEITSGEPRKPILAIKSGRTAAGARAASSHTGALAGSDQAYDALFAQCGVLRVESLEELFDYATAFAYQPLPKSNRVAIVTNAGGMGIMTTDAAVRYGLEMAEFEGNTQKQLQSKLPPAANIHNPVDVLGDAGDDRYQAALDAVLSDAKVDGAIVISTPQLMTDLKAVATAIANAAAGSDKPVLVCQMALRGIEEPLAVLEKERLPTYRFPEEAARALAAMARYAGMARGPRQAVKSFIDVDQAKVREVIDHARQEGRQYLMEPEAHQILQAYRFPVLPMAWVHSAEEAVKAARMVGLPLAMKIVSPQIIHKTDVGGVKLNLESEPQVEQAYEEIMAAASAAQPNALLEGVVIQKMAGDGKETILGMSRDPQFGPLLMFGLGGVNVEIFQDVIFRLAPITEEWAYRMMQDLKGFRVLTGYRGEPPADLDAIAECLERLSQLVLDFPEITELDINPLLVYEKGQGAAVLDARLFIEQGSSADSKVVEE